MFIHKMIAVFRVVLLGGALVSLCACAGPVERWIVDVRVRQGDAALARGNPNDAELAYSLALRVDPSDQRARDGFVEAAAVLAQAQYTKGDFDDALLTLAAALPYDPLSVRLQALRTTVEQAKLKREIVISNYPTYQETATQILRSYQQLDLTNKVILRDLRRFNYTYDTQDLAHALKQSYQLQLELAKNISRLALYRQLVESGSPALPGETAPTGAGSLLPLP
jgi:tetratricopeptide (TPR) repeat protein